MPVEPQLQNMLDQLNAAEPGVHFTVDAAAHRHAYRRGMIAAAVPSTLTHVASIRDDRIADVPVRIYDTETPAPKPSIVFYHGGGWIVGDVDTHDRFCRRITADVDAQVISVDYRLAPEDPFPAPFDDCWAVTKYVAEHSEDFGGGSLAIAGDSAGGNLAAAIAQHARDEGVRIDAQMLIYPALDLTGDEGTLYPSRVENAVGYRSTTRDVIQLGEMYAGTHDASDPRISPLLGELHDVAPAIVAVAEFDPLRDEGIAYAEKMRDTGIDVTLRNYDGLIHGFFGMAAISPASDAAISELNADLRTLLAR